MNSPEPNLASQAACNQKTCSQHAWLDMLRRHTVLVACVWNGLAVTQLETGIMQYIHCHSDTAMHASANLSSSRDQTYSMR